MKTLQKEQSPELSPTFIKSVAWSLVVDNVQAHNIKERSQLGGHHLSHCGPVSGSPGFQPTEPVFLWSFLGYSFCNQQPARTMSPSNFKCLWRMGCGAGCWNGRHLVLRGRWTSSTLRYLYFFLQSSLPSFRMNFSHPARSISSSLFSLPSVTLGPTPSYVPFPAYSIGTSR
jgi:hypothetical protein